MRIGIANDMPLAIEALRRAISQRMAHQVAWVARDGQEAIDFCVADTPDLVLMDLIMPSVDGVEATRQIMARAPCPILVVTFSVGHNAPKVYEAMGAGALDAVDTPTLAGGAAHHTADTLLEKIEQLGRISHPSHASNTSNTSHTSHTSNTAVTATAFPGGAGALASAAAAASGVGGVAGRQALPETSPRTPLLAIGASAGGPAALAVLLANLPADFKAAVVIVQHVDQAFAAGMADWLDSQSTLPVRLARSGETPQAGVVLLAGTNDHLYLNSVAQLRYKRDPADLPYRPSVDVFFCSIVEHWPARAIGVLLTGMGRDGARGLKELRCKGFHTITQDAASCAVYGMPKAAIEMGAAVEVLPLDQMGASIVRRIGN